MLHAIVESPVPPFRSLGIQDDGLWEIVERGLRKDPLDRWGSIRQLGEALALWLSDRGVGEDISGQSLAAAWLRTGAGALRSSRSPQGTPSVEVRLMPDEVSPGAAIAPSVLQAVRQAETRVLLVPPPARRKLPWALLAAGALVVTAGVIAFSVLGKGAETPTQTAEDAAQTAPTGPEAQAAKTTEKAASGTSLDDLPIIDDPAPSTAKSARATNASNATSAPAPRRQSPSAPKRKTRPSGYDYDFGF
jgi:serine/threonine-protein kinase